MAHRMRHDRAIFRRRRVGVALLAVGVIATGLLVVRSMQSGGLSSVGAGASGEGTTAPAATSGPPGTTAPPTTVTPPPDATVTITAVGDTMLGKYPSVAPNPATYFDAVHDDLVTDADIVFANLEGTLTNQSSSGKCANSTSGACFAFRVPPENAQGLSAAGFDVLNLANNHSFDFGKAGQDETAAAVRANGMSVTGLPGLVTVVPVGPVRVGFVGFGPYQNMPSLLDLGPARDLIASAAAQSDVTVVYMHAGAEGTNAQHVTGKAETYLEEARGNPQAFARMAVDNGADLVVASGPHVLRGAEFYKGHLISYSLGNFAGYGNFSQGGTLDNTAILRVTLSGTGDFRAGRFAPVRLVDKGRPTPGGDAVSVISRLSNDDFDEAAVVLAKDGTISPPT